MQYTSINNLPLMLIVEETGVARDTVERILLWELELQDRQYLTPDNYEEFMSDDLADLLELPRDLVARVLEAEQESLGGFDSEDNIPRLGTD